MKIFFSSFIFLFASFFLHAQFLTAADSLELRGDYEGALKLRLKSYKESPNAVHTYNLACCYALNRKTDSAFYFINQVIDIAQIDELNWLMLDKDLGVLRTDFKWNDIKYKLDEKLKNECKCSNKALALELRDMKIEDQQYRSYRSITVKRQELNYDEILSLLKIQSKYDSINQLKLLPILNKFGWPSISMVGKDGSQTAFLIIQHANNELQKKYVDKIKCLAKRQEADWESYASMMDRILIEEGKKQVYGTQFRYNPTTNEQELFPIKRASCVDKRRRKIGLHPILVPYEIEPGVFVHPYKIGK